MSVDIKLTRTVNDVKSDLHFTTTILSKNLVYNKGLINFHHIYAQLGLICLLSEFVIYEMWSLSCTMLLPKGIVKLKWP